MAKPLTIADLEELAKSIEAMGGKGVLSIYDYTVQLENKEDFLSLSDGRPVIIKVKPILSDGKPSQYIHYSCQIGKIKIKWLEDVPVATVPLLSQIPPDGSKEEQK